MTHARWTLTAALLLLVWASVLLAQGAVYKTRLSPMPVDANSQAATTGTGTVTATLRGTTLSLTGTFSGLQKPATSANLHVGPRGIPGPAQLPVTVTKATSGTISGELMLSSAQVDHLKRGRLYLQIQSEAAPEGNLRGWLLQ
jgi:hypothetical protein